MKKTIIKVLLDEKFYTWKAYKDGLYWVLVTHDKVERTLGKTWMESTVNINVVAENYGHEGIVAS